MAQLASMPGAETVTALTKAGWMKIGQVGNHVMMSKPGVQVCLSVPQQRMLSVGTLRVLLRCADLAPEQLLFTRLM
jgi:predicted RNA binding protein YcfA (HicA-like mRNA interferase family)